MVCFTGQGSRVSNVRECLDSSVRGAHVKQQVAFRYSQVQQRKERSPRGSQDSSGWWACNLQGSDGKWRPQAGVICAFLTAFVEDYLLFDHLIYAIASVAHSLQLQSTIPHLDRVPFQRSCTHLRLRTFGPQKARLTVHPFPPPGLPSTSA